MLSYRGQKRSGVATVGRTNESAEMIVRRAWRERWRWLDVHADSLDGHQVGMIGPDPDTGHRSWWCEISGH